VEIRRYLSIIRRRLLLVIAIVLAAVAAGFLVTPRDDNYTATSTLYVGSTSIDIDPARGELSADRVAGLDRLISTFAQMAQTRPIAAAAIEEAGIGGDADSVAGATEAQQLPNTSLLQVSYSNGDPAVAQTMTNAIAAALVDQVRVFESSEADPEAEKVISVYDEAQLPTTPSPSGLLRNLVLAAIFGLIVAGIVLATLEYLDITLRSPEDVERQLELPVLGVVPALGHELPIAPAVNVQSLVPRASPPAQQSGAPVG
jgi:receptor protein-tyrosine kinase